MKTLTILTFFYFCNSISANKSLSVSTGFASEKEFKHAALIGYELSKDDFDLECGGSLITKRFVLSGATCVFSSDRNQATYVKLGNVIRGEVNDNTYRYEIEERIKHPKFTSKSVDHDIALFKLEKDVEFNDFVQPACLPTKNEEPDFGIVAGWGKPGKYFRIQNKLIRLIYTLVIFCAGYGQDLSTKLKKIVMEIFTQEDCQKKYLLENGQPRNVIDYETKICAGSHNMTRIDTCHGDSGSALQIASASEDCTWIIVGVTSFGHANCGITGVPGGYTRVWHYIDWIKMIIGNQ